MQWQVYRHTHTLHFIKWKAKRAVWGLRSVLYAQSDRRADSSIVCAMPLGLFLSTARGCGGGGFYQGRVPHFHSSRWGMNPTRCFRTSGQRVSTPPVKTTQKPDRYITKPKMKLQTAEPKAAFHAAPSVYTWNILIFKTGLVGVTWILTTHICHWFFLFSFNPFQNSVFV